MASGATTINVGAGVYTDAVGNNNIAASEFNWTYSSSSSQTYSIDVVGYNNYYTLSGTDRGGPVSGTHEQVDLNVGDTVNFVVNANNHPFWIKTTTSTGTGNAVINPEATNNGLQNGTVSWTPSASGTYYYICLLYTSDAADE